MDEEEFREASESGDRQMVSVQCESEKVSSRDIHPIIHTKSKVMLISLPGLCTGDEPLFPLGIGYVVSALKADRDVMAVHYQRFEHAQAQMHEWLAYFRPDIVGLTCTTFNRGAVRKTVEWIRSTFPAIRIVLGGVHASYTVEQALNCYGADYVVIGEGEETFRELCSAIDGKMPVENVKGIAFRQDNQVILTPRRPVIAQLDDLPIPDFSFVEHLIKSSGMGFVITSRGCPVRCSFCATSSYWGQKIRMNSPERIVTEMELLVSKYGVRKIFFHDDTFNISLPRVARICSEIRARKLSVDWGVSCRVHPVSQEVVDLMVDTGCRHICWGIESGSPEMLSRIGKKITRNQIKQAYEACRKHLGLISVGAFTMVGNPGETDETIRETVAFLNTLPMTDSPSTSILYVLPGTALYQSMKEKYPELDNYWVATDDVPSYTVEQPSEMLSHWANMVSRSGHMVPLDRKGHFWNNILFGDIPVLGPPERPPPRSELDMLIPAEIKDDELYFLIQKLAREEKLRTVLEIGSSAGGGSTEAFVTGLRANPNCPTLYCMEISKSRFAQLTKRYENHPFVRFYNVSSVPKEMFPSEAEVSRFYHSTRTALNDYPLERVLGWLRQDIDYIVHSGVPTDGIQRIKRENGIRHFDMVLIDGSEFSGSVELDEVYGARFILLDDINGFKNYHNFQRLSSDAAYSGIAANRNLRNGYAFFKRNDQAPLGYPVRGSSQKASQDNDSEVLPVHFFTIVLNGEPFVRHHMEVFSKLPFRWHWHIVEGLADLVHDTAWSRPYGGKISDGLHRDGLSNDGTTEYLNEIVRRFPQNVSIYRKPKGTFWDGKIEMVNASLENICEQCLLWQVDVDELWTADQICKMRTMFLIDPQKTAAYFHCYYFVGPKKYVSSLNTWATYPEDWLRTWCFDPTMRWAAHEPPVLVNAKGQNVAHIDPFTRDATKAQGITFQHLAYATESQVRFKETYYGYKDALAHWQRLQQTQGPVNPANYLPWAKHDATVDDWPESNGPLLAEKLLDLPAEPRRIHDRAEHEQKRDLMKVDTQSDFASTVRELFRRIRPRRIIETGTYLGAGTTAIIASSLHDSGIRDAVFFTIEVNPLHHRQALVNIAQNSFDVIALNGLSIPRRLLPSAEEIEAECVNRVHQPGIFVDHQEHERTRLYFDETNFPELPDDLLGKCLQKFDGCPDFVLLDSAGHMGNIEFNYLISRLKGECYIALDDIYHIKHYKSILQIQNDQRFNSISHSREKFGWCIVKFSPNAETVEKAVNRILWLRTDSIGDNILAAAMLPHIRDKFPRAKVAAVCQRHIAELYDSCPYVDEVIPFDKERAYQDERYRNAILQLLRSFSPDLALNSVYSREPITDILTMGTNARKRLAFHGNLDNIQSELRDELNPFYTLLISNGKEHETELERHRVFLKGLGIDAPPLRPTVWTNPQDEEYADRFFSTHKLSSQKVIAMQPGAQWDYKVYDKYNAVLEHFSDCSLLLFGNNKDSAIVEEVCQRYPGNAHSLVSKTSLRQTSALVRRCSLYLGADSAVAHIACAVGIPNIVILGGGHFGRFFPYSPYTSVVCLPMECYRCNWRCRYTKPHCIKDIDPLVIVEAMRQTFESPSDKPRIFFQDAAPWNGREGYPRWVSLDSFLEGDSADVISTAVALSPKPDPGVGEAGLITSRPLLSIFTHGRNDSHMGNFLWRLSTQINKHARNIMTLDAQYEVELVLCDWGSEEPILGSLSLTDESKALLRVVEVPPAIGKKYDADSPYSMVHAANAAARRSSGKYIMYSDGDTYLPLESMRKLLNSLRQGSIGGLSLSHNFFWASRYHIPRSFHETSPSIDEIDTYIGQNWKTFGHDKVNQSKFSGTVTALLLERDMWEECRGFDERLIYWGWFDVDINYRLRTRYGFADLEDLGVPFFHLDHYSSSEHRDIKMFNQENPRRVNPGDLPLSFASNGMDWGLANEPLSFIVPSFCGMEPPYEVPPIAQTKVPQRSRPTRNFSPSPELVSMVNRIIQLREEGKLEEALIEASLARAKYPGFPDLLTLYAELNYKLENMEEARVALLTVLMDHPNDMNALNDLSAVLARDGNLAQAMRFVLKVLDLDPSNELAQRNLGWLKRSIAFSRLNQKAEVLIKQEQYSEARHMLKSILKMNSEHMRALSNLASLEIAQHNFNRARDIVSYSLQIDPNNESALANLARINRQAGT
jgi:radical SAM superfamily enzyme YgiQ (UPF0313 family)/ADP-heptose:LPS heptosyltransferase/predicted O-methyltransferase YrrM/Flp pilus assembly protein TadD